MNKKFRGCYLALSFIVKNLSTGIMARLPLKIDSLLPLQYKSSQRRLSGAFPSEINKRGWNYAYLFIARGSDHDSG